MRFRKNSWYSCFALLAALFGGCASLDQHEPRELNIPELRHRSPSRDDALTVDFSGKESELVRLSLKGPQGVDISGLPYSSPSPLIISSGYDYSIFCNGQQVPSRAKDPCRKHNPYTYSKGCDYSPGVSAKTTVIHAKESAIYCEITPFFWHGYCNPHEEGEEKARLHNHTFDGGSGCEWPDTQEVLVYLHSP